MLFLVITDALLGFGKKSCYLAKRQNRTRPTISVTVTRSGDSSPFINGQKGLTDVSLKFGTKKPLTGISSKYYWANHQFVHMTSTEESTPVINESKNVVVVTITT